MARVRKTFDSVRASRDGHEFHEAWVARKCLGLLLPKDDLVGVAIEGFGEADQKFVTAEANEIADAVLYFGRRAAFAQARRVVVVQVKYSKASELKPFRAADSKKTLDKFARIYRTCKRNHGAKKARDKLHFQLVTNRPIAGALIEALRGLAEGTVLKRDAKKQAIQVAAACKLKGKDLAGFAALVDMIGLTGDLREHKQELATTLADWSPARDHMARIRLNAIRDLVREKAGLARQKQNLISRVDVLSALQLSDERDLLPCPASFPAVGGVVDRMQLAETVALIPRLTKPLVVHAEAGVGKTVFMSSVAASLSTSHETVLFDCFGMGQYRAPDDARHLPGRGLVHIANDLACRGLCDPLLPSTSSSEDILRAFRARLEQVLATLRRGSSDRQLILLLDAIDNANELARDRGQDSFPKLLLQSLAFGVPIPGLQVVVSARSHRRRAATGDVPCKELELEPFTETETKAFLATRVPKLTEARVHVAQSRSLGNARILERLAEEPDLLAPSEVGKVIAVDDLIRRRIENALAEARKLGNPETNIRAFLAGLATLPPPVPLKEFAQVNGMLEGAVKSFAADLSPLVEQTRHGLMFRDEPTETLIREDYAADALTLRALANNLLAMQATSVYAATTLPDLLLQLSDGDGLFDLAFDERLPTTITSKVGQQAIRHARLRAAVGHAVRTDDLDRLVPLLVEMSTLAAMDQRGTQYILDHPDLVVTSGDVDSQRRLFEARTEWPGSRHARLAIAHALMGEVGDAIRHAQRVIEWRAHFYEQKPDPFKDRARPAILDMAAIPFCHFANGNGLAAARDMAMWRDWYAYDVTASMFELANRPEAKRFLSPKAIAECLTALDSPGPLAAAIRFVAVDKDLRRALIGTLAKVCDDTKTIDLGTQHYQLSQSAIVHGLLEAAAAAAVLGMRAEAKAIIARLSPAPPTLHTFRGPYWSDEVYIFVACQVVRQIADNKPVGERELLPAELIELAHEIPAGTGGDAFRTAMKAAMEERYAAKSKVVDLNERISYDSKLSAERFLDQRLSTWVRVANTFAQALGSRSGDTPTPVPLTRLWKELRIQKDYYSGGDEARRQQNAIGERLLMLALTADPGVDAKDVRGFLEAASEPGLVPVGKLIELVALLASRPMFQSSAGALAVKASTAIEQEDEVGQRAEHYASLGQAMAVASTAEAVEYFRRGLDQMDAIGSGDYQFVDGLMHFASSLQGPQIDERDSHVLSNICELNLGEERKFNWGMYGNAMARASGLQGLAKLTRWADRERVSLDFTLLPYLRSVVRDDQLDPALAVTLLRLSNPAELYVCGTEQFLTALESKVGGQDPTLARELVAQYLGNNPGSLGSEAPRALARYVKQVLGESSQEYRYLSAAADRIAVSRDDYNKLNNWRAPEAEERVSDRRAEEEAAKETVLSLAAGKDPLDDISVGQVLEAANAVRTGMRFTRDVLEVLRAKVAFPDWPRYVELIARQGLLDLYDKEYELRQCKEQWSGSSVAVDKALRDCAEIIVRENALEFISSDYLSTYHVKAFEEVCGVDRRTLLTLLVQELSHPKSPVPASVWLNFAAEFNMAATPGVGQAALSRLLQSGPAKLASSTEDGPWKTELCPQGDPVEVAGGMIWFVLGSPVGRRRWMAAHSLRTAVRLGRTDVLDAVVACFDRRDAAPFQAPELPFFYLHAQLWLLIAMARIALEAPDEIARHHSFLEQIAFHPTDHHVLRKHFAAQALAACVQSGELTLPAAKRKALDRVNRSPYRVERLKDYYGSSYRPSRPEGSVKPEPELRLDYDFGKDDVAHVANLFGQPYWETVDAMTAWVRGHDADITQMWEGGGRLLAGRRHVRGINPEYHTYGEQLCWHALHAVAGDLLVEHPVVRGQYDNSNPWNEWMERQVLTHADGLWLADGTDWQPVDTWSTLRVVGGFQRVELTSDPETLQTLLGIHATIGDWLVTSGDWNSTDDVGIHVMSAMAPHRESIALAESISAADPFQAYLPQLEPCEDVDAAGACRNAPYVPWVVVGNEIARLDEVDPLGGSGATQRRRLSKAAIDFGQLSPTDAFARLWASPSGEVQVRSELWLEPNHSDEGRTRGTRLVCRTSFIREFLAANHADLLLFVLLRRYETGYGDHPSRFWHTTAVVRVTPSLKFAFYMGRANELHKANY